MNIPAKLIQQLKDILLSCGAFTTDNELSVLFMDARIKTWRHQLKETDNQAARVLALIALLHARESISGENALILFLDVLSESIPKDAIHRDLIALRDELNRLWQPSPPVVVPQLSVEAPELVLVAAGPFCLGSSEQDAEAHSNEKPRRQIELPDFRIGRYPVTNAQYALFVKQTGHPPPWLDAQTPPDALLDHPVVNVSYKDAMAYCQWLSNELKESFRLPTEEEWEKAARGPWPNERRYVWGDVWRAGACNVESERTTAVSHYQSTNISPYGAIDMAGNVWEWTNSWYQSYDVNKYTTVTFNAHVVRGGSWANDKTQARLSTRGRYPPRTQRLYLGFRLVAY